MRSACLIDVFFQLDGVHRRLNVQSQSFPARRSSDLNAIDGTDAVLDDEQSSRDYGLNPNERSLKSELKHEKDAKKAKDVQLNETAHILFDAIGQVGKAHV